MEITLDDIVEATKTKFAFQDPNLPNSKVEQRKIDVANIINQLISIMEVRDDNGVFLSQQFFSKSDLKSIQNDKNDFLELEEKRLTSISQRIQNSDITTWNKDVLNLYVEEVYTISNEILSTIPAIIEEKIKNHLAGLKGDSKKVFWSIVGNFNSDRKRKILFSILDERYEEYRDIFFHIVKTTLSQVLYQHREIYKQNKILSLGDEKIQHFEDQTKTIKDELCKIFNYSILETCEDIWIHIINSHIDDLIREKFDDYASKEKNSKINSSDAVRVYTPIKTLMNIQNRSLVSPVIVPEHIQNEIDDMYNLCIQGIADPKNDIKKWIMRRFKSAFNNEKSVPQYKEIVSRFPDIGLSENDYLGQLDLLKTVGFITNNDEDTSSTSLSQDTYQDQKADVNDNDEKLVVSDSIEQIGLPLKFLVFKELLYSIGIEIINDKQIEKQFNDLFINCKDAKAKQEKFIKRFTEIRLVKGFTFEKFSFEYSVIKLSVGDDHIRMIIQRKKFLTKLLDHDEYTKNLSIYKAK